MVSAGRRIAGVPPFLLVILDGWGESPTREGNAIRLARTPSFDHLRCTSAHTLLKASGEDVGLPPGLMGNSEVGHLNLGAGRVVYQDIQRITRAIEDGSFAASPALAGLYDTVAARHTTLHLVGLLSDGGVHALAAHLVALVDLARDRGIEQVLIHAILDGRDTHPTSAGPYLEALEAHLVKVGVGRIASVAGRYYAMDRDQRWSRTERAWHALALGRGDRAATAQSALARAYAQGVTDEFVLPVVISPPAGAGEGALADGDGVVFFNFRADRARQLTRAIVADAFDGFERPRRPRVDLVTMTEYDRSLAVPVAFPPQLVDGLFADALAALGTPNLRVAETEKYAHVTYFFNGRVEAPWPGESRILVPSAQVATYDLAPEMSAREVTSCIIEGMRTGATPGIVANYANADMVGHTGRLAATVQAVEVLDVCLGDLMRAADESGYALFVTSDHGNAEQMIDFVKGGPHTAHTTNPVPFLARATGLAPGALASDGRLADVVPTILAWAGIDRPAAMTGRSLIPG